MFRAFTFAAQPGWVWFLSDSPKNFHVMKIIQKLALGAFSLLVSSQLAFSQVSNTEGLFLNIGATNAGLSSDLNLGVNGVRVFDRDGGGGVSLKAGYGFSPLFTLYAGYSIAGMERNGTDIPLWRDDDQYALSLFELGGRFTFRDDRKKFRPYADVALTSTAAVFDNDPEISAKGGALTLGGGGQYFLSNVFALDASLLLSPGGFSNIVFVNYTTDVGDDGGFLATRFSLGLSVYPFQ